MLRRRNVFCVFLVLPAAVAALTTARADDPAENKAEAARPESRQGAEDPFRLPAGGVKELLAFIVDMDKLKPAPGAPDPSGKMRYRAVRLATAQIARLATEEDRRLPGFNDAIGMHFRFRTSDAARSAAARSQLRDDLKAHFAETPDPSDHALAAARALCGILEYGENPRAAIACYRELGAILAEHDDERAAKSGRRMLGAARRLGLVGQPLEITGTRLDGSRFDLKTLRGKVVLVDFWATWCGPCTKEFPNVKKNYERYHDQGFEVVAISVDGQRKALDDYLAGESLPWITLYDGAIEDSPLAIAYGISGIPTTLLVDRQGKVVSLDARGEELDRRLADLFAAAGN